MCTVSLYRSYTSHHHGLYVSSDASFDSSPSSMSYQWLREYVNIPTPAVERDNNFFFSFAGNTLLYAKYDERIRIAKRTTVWTAKQHSKQDHTGGRPVLYYVCTSCQCMKYAFFMFRLVMTTQWPKLKVVQQVYK